MAKSGKGANWERQFSKELSLWLSEGERDDLVWRTSQSGGRATQRAKQGKKTAGSYGDITWTDPSVEWFFKLFSVELKCGYKDATIDSLINSNQKKPLIIQFWEQCERDRRLSGAKYSLLILKKDRKVPLAIMSPMAYVLFRDYSFPDIQYNVQIRYGKIDLLVFRLEHLFDGADPKGLKKCLEELR